MIQFRVLSVDDAERIREWRNEDLSMLRTPFLLTAAMQEDWYKREVSNREARSRWWGIWHDCGDLQPEGPCWHHVGYAGLESIEWENRRAEVSLLVAPSVRGHGVGRDAVDELLRQAFVEINLHSVHGLVYECGPVQFWRKVLPPGTSWFGPIPSAKYTGGQYHGAWLFVVERP